jgi:pyrroline-5-carboxylate reductase
MSPVRVPLAIVGGGNIARAILKGAEEAGVIDPARVVIAEPDEARRRGFEGAVAAVVPSAVEAMVWMKKHEGHHGEGQILLAVKPQSLDEVGRQLRPALGLTRRVFISLLAGTPTQRVRDCFGDPAAVVRVMPNLAVQLKRAITALAVGAGARDGDEDNAAALFSGVGTVIEIEEDLMDAFTAVAGSGPAYVFYLAEAMVKAATELGFDHRTAEKIVRETVAGAGLLLAAAAEEPHALRMRVTSPGGTTAAALEVMEHGQALETIVKAIHAAKERGAELGKPSMV